MYHGGYPEPFNDPDYEENCDPVTDADMLRLFSVVGLIVIVLVIMILCR